MATVKVQPRQMFDIWWGPAKGLGYKSVEKEGLVLADSLTNRVNEETKFTCTWSFIGGMGIVLNSKQWEVFLAVNRVLCLVPGNRSRTQSHFLGFAAPASLWSWQVMIILIREFSTPDEEMKKIVLKAWFADFDQIPSWFVVRGAAWCPGSLGSIQYDPFRNPNQQNGMRASHIFSHENDNCRWSSSALPQRVLNPATFARLVLSILSWVDEQEWPS